MYLPRVRRIAAAVSLTCALALAACESQPPPTAPRAPVVQATTSHTSTGMVAHEIEYSDPEGAVDYWTSERMRSARPVAPPGLLGFSRFGAPMAAAGEHQTRKLAPRAVLLHPHASIGKVFFTLWGFDFVCSASAVTSAGRWGEGSRNLIVTAGHCLNDGAGTFASKFIFVPGYHDGNAPLGRWLARTLFTTNAWNSGFGLAFSRDVAFAQMGTGFRKYAGSDLHDVVDALGIAFSTPYWQDGLRIGVTPGEGTEYASFGYGLMTFGGEDQVRTLSSVATLDANFFPAPLGMPSTHTGGSSGGPWIYRYAPTDEGPVPRPDRQNLVNSVNSYVYFGIDRIYGPQFDDLIHSLWMFAATH